MKNNINHIKDNPYIGEDVLEHLASIIPDTAEMRRVGKEEWLRLALTDAIREARKRAGLSQKDVAKELGVSQGWVSKLESAHYDHQIESVVSLLDAVGAELVMAIKVENEMIPVQPEKQTDDILVNVPYFVHQEAKAAGMKTRDFISSSVKDYQVKSNLALPSNYESYYIKAGNGGIENDSENIYENIAA